jgi:F420H(2)-dependent quinone reductase
LVVEHANRYLSSGGTDGHMYKPTQPGRPDMTVPSLLLTTTGRKSGQKFIFPLYYGKAGDSYIVVASKGGAQPSRSPLSEPTSKTGRATP